MKEFKERDAWKVDYNAEFDPISTGAAYGSREVPPGEEKEFEMFTRKADYGLSLMDRLSSDSAKTALRDRVEEALGNFLLLEPHSIEVQDAKKRLLDEKDMA